MNIHKLILIVKKKIENNISFEDIKVEDKTFLHKKHKNHQENKFHLKLIIKSQELNKMKKIEANKKIYNILDEEIKIHIHSIQVLIN